MTFLPEKFKITEWSLLKPYYDKLVDRSINSEQELRQFLLDLSSVEASISEDIAWRYITMTRHTDNDDFRNSYDDFIKNIQPNIAPYHDKLNRIINESKYRADLYKDPDFVVMLRSIEQSIRIYREANIPLFTAIAIQAKNYDKIAGDMTVVHAGSEVTLQQAAVLLESTERSVREEVYLKIANRRLQDKDKLNDVYSDLIKKRHEVAYNAGFDNYRDYMFVAMDRFDYSPQMCYDFHDAVEKEILPLINTLAQERKDALCVSELKPWDKAVDIYGRPPLVPFSSEAELLQKTIAVFDSLDPYFGDCLRAMQKMNHLDLSSRKGKAPGGYNYPLDVTGVPFIFMNATSTLGDMVTMVHEGGHAVHSFLTKSLPLNDFKHCSMEVAELASMSMELLTMHLWDRFFDNEEDLRRAKREHITQMLSTIAWVATIDCFQHWVYTNPNHTVEDRKRQWNVVYDRFSDKITDWSRCEIYKDYLWQNQLHLYEVPFYYIEYGIAQLGAVSIWREHTENPAETLKKYKNALSLGNTRSIPEIYETAGIRFDFTADYVKGLAQFLSTYIANV